MSCHQQLESWVLKSLLDATARHSSYLFLFFAAEAKSYAVTSVPPFFAARTATFLSFFLVSPLHMTTYLVSIITALPLERIEILANVMICVLLSFCLSTIKMGKDVPRPTLVNQLKPSKSLLAFTV